MGYAEQEALISMSPENYQVCKDLLSSLEWLMNWPLPDGKVKDICIGRIPKEGIEDLIQRAKKVLK